MIRLIAYGVAATLLLSAGTGAGYTWRSEVATHRRTICAASIVRGDLKDCSADLRNALQARAAMLAEQDIAVRDDAMQSISDGAAEQIIIYRERAASVAALNNVERTTECAASPAISLRRIQLQRDAEGDAADQSPPADAPG